MTTPEQIRLKRLFASSVGGSWGNPPEEEGIAVRCVRGTDLDFQRLQIDLTSAPMRSYPAAEIQYRGAAAGDIIIEKSGGGENQPVGRVGLYDGLSTVMPTNFAGRLRPRSDQDPRYLTYLLAAQYFAGRTRAAIKQTTGIQNLEVEVLLATKVPRFPQSTQRAIADYLDTETARIDALITKKRRMIALLEERWITDIDVSLWSGGSTKLKHVAELLPGYAFPSAEFGPDHDGARLLRGTNVGVGRFDWSDAVCLATAGNEHARYRLASGDVLLGMDRPFIKSGTRVAVAGPDEEGALLVQRVCRIRPSTTNASVLIAGAIRSPRFAAYIESDLTGVSVPHLSDEQIGEFRVPASCGEGDEELVRSLGRATARFKSLSERLTRQIDLLIEHRQALITAAVTGELSIPKAA